MSYTLQALIAQEAVLKRIAEQNAAMVIVPLDQDMNMIPVGTNLRKLLGRSETEFNQDEYPFYSLSDTIRTYALNASVAGQIAYVEAELFGGAGYQSAVVWENQNIIFGPSYAERLADTHDAY